MNDQSCRIAVALATYNGERFLPPLLDSISRQTFQNIEIVVSDDGSTDGTIAVLEDYATQLPLRIIGAASHNGVVRNFERALAGCTAPYVALADQDDMWLPTKLEALLRAIQTAEMQCNERTPILAFSDLSLVDENLVPIAHSFYRQTLRSPKASKPRDFRFSNHVPGCATMLNRPLLDAVLPFPDVPIHDWWINLMAAYLGTIVFVPEPLINYRQHQHNAVGIGSATAGGLPKVIKALRDPAVFLKSRIEQARSLADDIAALSTAAEERLRRRCPDGPAYSRARRMIEQGCLSQLAEIPATRKGARLLDVLLTLHFLARRLSHTCATTKAI